MFLTSCSNSGSGSGSSKSYQHHCDHCGNGFNGSGYIKDSGGDVMEVSSGEVESFPGHYCSKSCAIID